MAPTPIPRVTTVLLGIIFCDALNQMLIFPFVPFLVRDQLGLSADDPLVPLYAGLLAAAYLFGQFLCSPFYGALSEKLGRRPVLITCVAISTAFLIAFGLSQSYYLSLLLRSLQGMTAGALTVGKLYLSDISDPTNEGRIFSFIGIAMGAGCISGPAIGGYLADPELLNWFPELLAPFANIIKTYPYMAPCVAAAFISLSILAIALIFLTESAPGHQKPPPGGLASTDLGKPLLVNMHYQAAATRTSRSTPSPPTPQHPTSTDGHSASNGSLATIGSGSTLLDAMSSHAGRTDVIVSDDGKRLSSGDGSPIILSNACRNGSPPTMSSPQLSRSSSVSAVQLAMEHALSPVASRADLFAPDTTKSLKASPLAPAFVEAELPPEERRVIFWTVQLASLLFTMTNVGLTEVLPVWLAAPPATISPAASEVTTGCISDCGLALSSSAIGTLQSTTGFVNIGLALFFTYRLINAIGPVNTFIVALFTNAAAGFAAPLVGLLPAGTPDYVPTTIMCAAYSFVAASRNMMFATAIMLSKESAPSAAGVAIGINQSACSLGSALGPMLSGFSYTQALQIARTPWPFFVGLGVVAAQPGLITRVKTPAWPWHVLKLADTAGYKC